MKRNFIHNAFFRLLAPLLFGIMVYLLILLAGNNLGDLAAIFNNEELYVCIGITYISFECLRLAIVLLNKIPFKEIRVQALVSIVVSVPIELIMLTLSLAVYYKLRVGFDISLNELIIFWIVLGFTGLLYNILAFSNEYLFRENTLLMEQESKLKEKVESDFSAFRNEINPDLLYESLETLLTSLHKRTEEAEKQIDLLADVYRYQLINRKKELVKWSEEQKALKSLCDLLNFRYQDQILIKEQDPQNDQIFVVPGSFLVALDAVVRNTLVSPDSPLNITLYIEDDDYIVMQHAINDKLVLHQESLNNFSRLQRSYSFFSDQPFVQVKADRENFIKFPMIKVSEENPSQP